MPLPGSSLLDKDDALPDLDLVESPDDIEIVQVGTDTPDWMEGALSQSPADALRSSREEDVGTTEPPVEEPEIKPEVQARLDAAERARSAAERMARETEDRTDQQLYQAHREKAAIQRDSFKVAVDAIDVRIVQAEQALASAAEAGDKGEEVRLGRIMRDLEKARDTYAHQQTQVPSDAAIEQQFNEYRRTKASRQPAREAQGSDEPLRALNPKATAWVTQNPWMRDPKFKSVVSYVQGVNDELAAEGKDPSSDDFFLTIARKVAKAFPDIPVKMHDGRAVGVTAQARPQQRQTAPVASARTIVAPGQKVNGKYRANINGNDRALMRTLGLDPTNEKVAKRFAQERIALMARDQQRGR